MRCRKVNRLLQEYLDGTLDREIRAKLEEHLKGCKKCQQELELLNIYLKRIGNLEDIKAPEDFLQGVRSRIRETSKGSRARVHIRLRAPLELAGAVAAILIAVIIFRNILPAKKEEIRPSVVQEAPYEKRAETDAVTKSQSLDKEKDTSLEEAREEKYKETKKAAPTPERVKEERRKIVEEPEPTGKKIDVEAEEIHEDKPVEIAEERARDREKESEPYEKTSYETAYQGEEALLEEAFLEKALLEERKEPEEYTVQLSLAMEMEKPLPPAAKIAADEVQSKGMSFNIEEEREISPKKENTEKRIKDLTQKHGGTVISLEYREEANTLRSITVRIPHTGYNSFVEELKGLGELKFLELKFGELKFLELEFSELKSERPEGSIPPQLPSEAVSILLKIELIDSR